MRLDVLDLGRVTLPEWHPLAATDGFAIIRSVAISHPDGVILFDTGVADDHDLLNEMYRPEVVPIPDALHGADVDERDVVAIVNSHLHFDHCGQNRNFPGVPVYAQAPELEAAETPHYTIPEWAHIDAARLRRLDGDEEIAPGVHVLATPGHTPGHQSVLVEAGDDERTLLVGQACYTCAQFETGVATDDNVHDETWMPAALDSITRLRSLGARTAHFSHDDTVFRRA